MSNDTAEHVNRYGLDTDDQKDLWGTFATDERLWASKAAELIYAADRLHGPPRRRRMHRNEGEAKFKVADHGRTLGVAMMLYGMSLECLFKAIAAHNGHSFAEDDEDGEPEFKGLFNNSSTNHNLVALSCHEKVRLDLSAEELDLAKRLSPYIMWGGRYPVATRWEKQFGEDMAWDYDHDYELIHQLAARLYERLGVTLDDYGLAELPDQIF